MAEQAAGVASAKHEYEAANQTLSFRAKDDYLMAETAHRLMDMYSTTVIPQAAWRFSPRSLPIRPVRWTFCRF